MKREDILALLAREKPNLAKEFKVKALGLFGSYVRGDEHPGSDIDILVDIDPAIGLEFVTLAERLEDLLGERVELVSKRAVKPRFMKHIEKDLMYV
ncbi:MAG: nucleotidyltransferase family protein [Desulfobulbaceae bacterium]|nr:nucleotidyltransferase family protein [Desulfobulbaceae bacterium]